MKLFTIGHSNIPLEQFLALLNRHAVEVLVDVRSAPYSRYCPQFNKPALQRAVEAAGLRYEFAGQALGGKPAGDALCRADGTPDYDLISASEAYQDGLRWLEALLSAHRVAIMCSEAEPAKCHRENLIARSLRARGVEVIHIRADGSADGSAQGSLFG